MLTGSGHFFNECISLINELEEVDVLFQKQQKRSWSCTKKKDISPKVKIYKDNSASSVSVGKFYKNEYHTLVMAPTSSNTVAKCVYGISDSLATNIFAQAGKCRVECIYFPCDTAPELKTLAPSGYVDVFPRKVDLKNVERLKKFSDTLTVMSFKKLKEAIFKRKKCLKKFYS